MVAHRFSSAKSTAGYPTTEYGTGKRWFKNSDVICQSACVQLSLKGLLYPYSVPYEQSAEQRRCTSTRMYVPERNEAMPSADSEISALQVHTLYVRFCTIPDMAHELSLYGE